MSKGYSGLFEGTSGASYERGQLPLVMPNPILEAIYREEHTVRTVYGKFSTKINEAKQGKHIPGHKYYQSNKSPFSISMQRAQELLNRYGGTGRKVGQSKEKINFHEIIGTWINEARTEHIETTWGMVHYSKNGAHIVPAKADNN